MVVVHPKDELVWKVLETILPEDLFTTVHITVTPDEANEVPNLLRKIANLGVNAIMDYPHHLHQYVHKAD